MSYEYLKVETDQQVRTIRLDRPEKRNALSMKLRDELESCLNASDAAAAVAVVILTGGERAFSAGFDLQEVVATKFETFRYRAREYSRALYGFSKPLITAVSGPAMAGGFDLALAGDIIVASETAAFGHPEVNFGAAPTTAVLWTRVGLARAKELAMLGSTIKAEEALRIGLVNRVVPVDKMMSEAAEIARKLAAKPPGALKAIKQASRRLSTLELFDAMDLEGKLGSEALTDPENIRRSQAYFSSLKGRR